MKQKRFRVISAIAVGLLVAAGVTVTVNAVNADTPGSIGAFFGIDSTTIPAHASSSRTIDVDVSTSGPVTGGVATFDFSGLAGVATASLAASYHCTVTGSSVSCPVADTAAGDDNEAHLVITVTSIAAAADGATGTLTVSAAATGIDSPGPSSTAVAVSDSAALNLADADRGDRQADPGDSVSMAMDIANLGSQSAPNVQIIFSTSHGFSPANYDNCLYGTWTPDNGLFVACTVPGPIAANAQVKVHGGFNGTIAADSATMARVDVYMVTTTSTTPTAPTGEEYAGVTFTHRPTSGHSLTFDTEPLDGSVTAASYPGGSVFYYVNTTRDIAAVGTNVVGQVGETVNATIGFKDNGPAALDNWSGHDPVASLFFTMPTWATAVTVPTNCYGSNSPNDGTGTNGPGMKYYECYDMDTYVLSVGGVFSVTIALKITSPSGTDGTVMLYDHFGDPDPSDPNPANKVAPVTLTTNDGTANGNALVPLAPVRILDTRAGLGAAKAKVGAGATIALQVTGKSGIPTTGVTAVVMNVTGVNASANTYLTVFPDGQAIPSASSLNLAKGQTLPNLVTVRVTNGKIDINNHAGTVDVLADVTGYYTNTATGTKLTSIAPDRILDTRKNLGGSTGPVVKLKVAGVGGVPAGGVSAVVMNVTAVNPTASSYVTVYPDGGSGEPNVSNLNFVAGQTVANLVVVPVTNGYVDLANAHGSVDLLADVTGYYSTVGSGFHATAPLRLMDTRNGVGVPQATVGPNGTVTLTVEGAGGIPATGVTAVVLNVTVTGATVGSYVTIYPNGLALPNVSNLNFVTGQTIANLVVVPVLDGKIVFHNANGNTQVIGDLAGYFTS